MNWLNAFYRLSAVAMTVSILGVSAFGNEEPLRPAKSVRSFSTFMSSANASPMGGNISGGGEGYRVWKDCRVLGTQLSDFARPSDNWVDTFEARKNEPLPTRLKFNHRSALDGIPMDLERDAPGSLRGLHEILKLGEARAPITVALIRRKLGTMKWYWTPLPFQIKFDNLAEGMNFQNYYAGWNSCPNAAAEPFRKWEGPVANFVSGKGVFVNTFLWSRLGDLSRSALLAHEALRSLQFDELVPLSDAAIRDAIHALFRTRKNKQIDSKLLQFTPDHSGFYGRFGSEHLPALSYACGINMPSHAIFGKNHFRDFARTVGDYAQALGDRPATPLPWKKSFEQMSTDEMDAAIKKIRSSVITENLANLASLPRELNTRWFEKHVYLSADLIRTVGKSYLEMRKTECEKFVFNRSVTSIEPPKSAYKLTQSLMLLMNLMHQVSLRNPERVESPFKSALSPLLLLPARWDAMNPEILKRMNSYEKGWAPEVVAAVGGTAEFQVLNAEFGRWWVEWDQLRRFEHLNSLRAPAWPKSYFGPGLIDFIRNQRLSD